MKTTRKQGFTMIEMLVVIVIIGILAGSMVPSIAGFMLNGKLTGMQGKGRQIVMAMKQADTKGNYAGFVWPSSSYAESAPEEQSNGPNMYQDFATTAKYFEEALYVKESDIRKRTRLRVLDLEPSVLSGEGINTASGTTINDNNCAWALAKNTSGVTESVTPILVTRNVNVAQLISVPGNDVNTDAETLLNNQKPFQKDGCVVMYKSGSGKTFTANEVTPKKILEGLGSSKLSDFEESDGNKFEFLSSGKSN